jgi:hypothetical protein
MRKSLSFLLVLTLVTGFFGARECLPSDPAAKESGAGYEKIPLKTILNNPASFQHRKVMVAGVFCGWQGKGAKNPGITRSDWVVEDASGAMYVAGAPPSGLDPVKDLGRPVTLWGTLNITGKGIPYLTPDKVDIGKGK